MGVGAKQLYAFVSSPECTHMVLCEQDVAYDAEQNVYCVKEGGIRFGSYIYVPNNLENMKYGDPPRKVRITKSDADTGIWVICGDAYFYGEIYITNYHPEFTSKELHNNVIDFVKFEEIPDDTPDDDPRWQNDHLHIIASLLDFPIESGDNPVQVTIKVID